HVLRAFHKAGDGLVAALERRTVTQRVVQPVAQQPAAHAGRALIEERKEGGGSLAAKRLGELEIAAAGGIESHEFAGALGADRSDMRERLALRLASIFKERAAGADGKRQVLDAVPG